MNEFIMIEDTASICGKKLGEIGICVWRPSTPRPFRLWWKNLSDPPYVLIHNVRWAERVHPQVTFSPRCGTHLAVKSSASGKLCACGKHQHEGGSGS